MPRELDVILDDLLRNYAIGIRNQAAVDLNNEAFKDDEDAIIGLLSCLCGITRFQWREIKNQFNDTNTVEDELVIMINSGLQENDDNIRDNAIIALANISGKEWAFYIAKVVCGIILQRKNLRQCLICLKELKVVNGFVFKCIGDFFTKDNTTTEIITAFDTLEALAFENQNADDYIFDFIKKFIHRCIEENASERKTEITSGFSIINKLATLNKKYSIPLLIDLIDYLKAIENIPTNTFVEKYANGLVYEYRNRTYTFLNPYELIKALIFCFQSLIYNIDPSEYRNVVENIKQEHLVPVNNTARYYYKSAELRKILIECIEKIGNSDDAEYISNFESIHYAGDAEVAKTAVRASRTLESRQSSGPAKDEVTITPLQDIAI